MLRFARSDGPYGTADLSSTNVGFGPQRVNTTLALESAPSITIEIAAST